MGKLKNPRLLERWEADIDFKWSHRVESRGGRVSVLAVLRAVPQGTVAARPALPQWQFQAVERPAFRSPLGLELQAWCR